MKTTKLLRSFASLVIALGAIQLHAVPMGTAFTYQGRLNDGTNPVTGIYDLRFAIYDLADGGGQQGAMFTTNGVPVTNGYFIATLDFGNQFNGDARWLEIGVRTNGGGAFTTLNPRQPLTPTPYALFASNTATLGGQAPGAFAPATGSDTYVAKSGDTMIGALGIKTSGYLVGSVDTVGGIAIESPAVGYDHRANAATKAGIIFGANHSTGNEMFWMAPDSVLGNRFNIGEGLYYDTNTILTLAAGGNVGIGTTTPAERLDLGNNGNLRIAANPGSDASPGNVCYELAARAAGGGENAWRIWTAAVGGGYGVPPNSFSVWQYPPSGEPRAFQRFTILPTPAGTGADPFIIDPYGNVGIGTTTPAAKLDVFDGSHHLRFTGDAIGFSAGDSPGYVYCSDPSGRIDFVTGGRFPQDSNASLLLLTNLDAIFNGNVGISTPTPAAKLDVNGTVRASGVISAVGGLMIENRTSDPINAAPGRIWLRTDL